ncbi:MAG TPA: glutathione-dependent reductase [Propionibacteriaceae bacterium]|nr:glutathione-dependent reductase [Propionibacteriaceae bacterium]
MSQPPPTPGSPATNPAASAPSRGAKWITGRVTRDSASGPGEGPDDQGRWPLEPGRYRLVISLACPWAHRANLTRRVLGLDQVISLAVVDPIRDERGWRFWLDPDHRDPILGIEYLSEAYRATDPAYAGRFTVPALIDTLTGQVVTNDFPQLSPDLITEWVDYHQPHAPQLLPTDPEQREEHDELAEQITADVNRGVYRVGYAEDQHSYEAAYDRLFGRLDQLSQRLESRRFLFGDTVRDADIRLFTTLVRFDAVYHGLFRCNRHKLSELPVLWNYLRDLYQRPGFGDTVDFDHIKRHYYLTDTDNNPSGILPKGPDLSGWPSLKS